METNVAALIQQRQNEFIENRTKIEAEVNKFLKSLETQDADIRQRCNVVDGRTARDVLPSLWAEDFNIETYNAELANLNNYIAYVKQVQDENNREALECLQS